MIKTSVFLFFWGPKNTVKKIKGFYKCTENIENTYSWNSIFLVKAPKGGGWKTTLRRDIPHCQLQLNDDDMKQHHSLDLFSHVLLQIFDLLHDPLLLTLNVPLYSMFLVWLIIQHHILPCLFLFLTMRHVYHICLHRGIWGRGKMDFIPPFLPTCLLQKEAPCLNNKQPNIITIFVFTWVNI